MSATHPAAKPTTRSNPRLFFLLAFGFTLGLLVLLGLGLLQRGAAPLASGLAPDFTLTTFEGQTYRLSELRGKPVIINFWASWCVPCREEAPLLQAAWEKYRDQGLVLLGVDYVDTETEAKKYLAEFKITYPNGPDLGTKISQAYRIKGVPETYFVTREGALLAGQDAAGLPLGNWIGPIPEAAFLERINRLMAP